MSKKDKGKEPKRSVRQDNKRNKGDSKCQHTWRLDGLVDKRCTKCGKLERAF